MDFITTATELDSVAKLLIVLFIIVCLMFIFSIVDGKEKPIDVDYMSYLTNHTSGAFLKDIYIDKNYMIIFDTFFLDGSMYDISDAKREFLVKSSIEYNIVVCAECLYNRKYFRLVDYCRAMDLPICRIVDLKPGNLIKNKKTLSDNSTVYYYTRAK